MEKRLMQLMLPILMAKEDARPDIDVEKALLSPVCSRLLAVGARIITDSDDVHRACRQHDLPCLKISLDEQSEADSFLPHGLLSVLSLAAADTPVVVADITNPALTPEHVDAFIARATQSDRPILSVTAMRDNPAQCETYHTVLHMDFHALRDPEAGELPPELTANGDLLWAGMAVPFEWLQFGLRGLPGTLYSLNLPAGESLPLCKKSRTVAGTGDEEWSLLCPGEGLARRLFATDSTELLQRLAAAPLAGSPIDGPLLLLNEPDGFVGCYLKESVAWEGRTLRVRAVCRDSWSEMAPFHLPSPKGEGFIPPGTAARYFGPAARWRLGDEHGYGLILLQPAQGSFSDLSEPVCSAQNLWAWDGRSMTVTCPETGNRFAGRQDLATIFRIDGTLVYAASGDPDAMHDAWAQGEAEAFEIPEPLFPGLDEVEANTP